MRHDVKTTAFILLAVTLSIMGGEKVWAGGFTAWAVPTKVVTTGGKTLLIEGTFGNHEGCGTADGVFIPEDVNNLKLVSVMAMSALLTNRPMRFYVDSCESYDGTTYNRSYLRNAQLR